MTTVDWPAVRARLDAFLSGPGQPRTAPPLTEQQVAEAESEFGVTFPPEYRDYLLQVSAGGWFVFELRRTAEGWRWDGHGTDYDRLHLPFPDHDTALALSDELYDGRPQPEDFADPAEYGRAEQASELLIEEAECARTAGLVKLTDDGCGFSTGLVLGGPHRGTVWFDGRATCDRLNPLLNDADKPAGFAEWFVDWLDHVAPLAGYDEYRAANSRWHRGQDTPIARRWFDNWRDACRPAP
ncbi:SMI1/KNR4 family protein [Kitasatospora sp. NPDC051984]|uniref:SMI1/KNR4 family protein n=1 Tax=Kitasatospora sp. NPDC051984 TaxID=3364059 RepID=UPI0037CA8C0D